MANGFDPALHELGADELADEISRHDQAGGQRRKRRLGHPHAEERAEQADSEGQKNDPGQEGSD